jgi:GNAT superfamily N-acetyltransferase
MSPLMPPQQAAPRRYSARCQYLIETVSPISPACSTATEDPAGASSRSGATREDVSMHSDERIRRADPDDVPAIVGLVHELAGYQKAPDECRLTAEQLHAALFGPAPAVFCHVAQLDGDVVGCALWFLNFSTWRGVHGIYLEDLYVQPAHRGSGLGKALLVALAQECVRRDYERLEWSVLKWNAPAIDFYKSIGAEPMDELTAFRLTDAALADLSDRARR